MGEAGETTTRKCAFCTYHSFLTLKWMFSAAAFIGIFVKLFIAIVPLCYFVLDSERILIAGPEALKDFEII